MQIGKPLGMDGSLAEARVTQYVGEPRAIALDAIDAALINGGNETIDGLVPCRRAGDELGQHRVEEC